MDEANRETSEDRVQPYSKADQTRWKKDRKDEQALIPCPVCHAEGWPDCPLCDGDAHVTPLKVKKYSGLA